MFKVATVYAVTAWGASMGASSLLPAFGAPDWAVRVFVLCAALGLPIAIVLAWAYQVTPTGIVREPESSDDGADSEAPSPANLTLLAPSAGTVRVTWQDSRGKHERTFNRGFQIGRDDACDIHLDDALISRRHAEVSYEDGLWWIRDLGSRNGTLVDGQRVTRVPLPVACDVQLHEMAPVLRLDVRASSKASTITSARVHRLRN